jgi:hypothetical protein
MGGRSARQTNEPSLMASAQGHKQQPQRSKGRRRREKETCRNTSEAKEEAEEEGGEPSGPEKTKKRRKKMKPSNKNQPARETKLQAMMRLCQTGCHLANVLGTLSQTVLGGDRIPSEPKSHHVNGLPRQ